MDHDSKTNEIRVKKLRGLNERQSPDNNDESDFDVCRGLYPSKVGLLSRLPGSTLLSIIGSGDERVLGYCQTFDGSGNIIVQTDVAIYTATLDELLGRESDATNLVYTAQNEEESMSLAIIVQRHANTTKGGSVDGILATTASTAAADTFFARRLTDVLHNESSTISSSVMSAAADTAPNTVGEGRFTLVPGSYRITGHFTFCGDGSTKGGICVGLYNVTSSAFEVYADGSPILASVGLTDSNDRTNFVLVMDAAFTVTSTNKTYEIRQKASSTAIGRNKEFGGRIDEMTGANVNGAAATQTYAIIKLLKTS